MCATRRLSSWRASSSSSKMWPVLNTCVRRPNTVGEGAGVGNREYRLGLLALEVRVGLSVGLSCGLRGPPSFCIVSSPLGSSPEADGWGTLCGAAEDCVWLWAPRGFKVSSGGSESAASLNTCSSSSWLSSLMGLMVPASPSDGLLLSKLGTCSSSSCCWSTSQPFSSRWPPAGCG